jgi:PAS domain S-box-containing protein
MQYASSVVTRSHTHLHCNIGAMISVETRATDDRYFQMDPYGIDKGVSSCLSFIENFDFGWTDGISRILAFTMEHMGMKAVQFGCFDFEHNTLRVHEQCAADRGNPGVSFLNQAVSLTAFVEEARTIAVCQDLKDSAAWAAMPKIHGFGLRSYVGCPIKLNGDLHGSLMAFDSKPRCFDASEITVIKIVAMLISQVEAYREVQQSFEDRLYESEALTYQMLQLSPAAIYTFDLRAQRFMAVNDYMCESTGYTEEELLSMKPYDLLTPKSRQCFFQRWERIDAGQTVPSDMELEIQTKDGGIKWGRFHIRHLYKDDRIIGANVVGHFVTEQKKARDEHTKYRRQLEALIQSRTAELAWANEMLREEIERRAETAEKLRISSDSLKEMNTAMRVLLNKRTEDLQRAEEVIRMNLKELIDPYLERLENSCISRPQRQLLDVIRMNLDEVAGTSTSLLSSKYYMLSPNEVQVVNLIRKGKTTKEMSRLLNVSVRTIEAYRNSIRKKFNLKNKKINLRTFLSSL